MVANSGDDGLRADALIDARRLEQHPSRSSLEPGIGPLPVLDTASSPGSLGRACFQVSVNVAVVLIELLQPLGVIGLHGPVLVAPTVPGRLGDDEVAGHLPGRLALAKELLALSQLPDDLLWRVPTSLHRALSSFPTSWGLDAHNG